MLAVIARGEAARQVRDARLRARADAADFASAMLSLASMAATGGKTSLTLDAAQVCRPVPAMPSPPGAVLFDH